MPRGIFKNPELTRQRMSEAKKGKMPKNFYDIQKLAILKNTGRKQSKEQIENRVRKNTGQKRTNETKERMSKAQKGKIVTQEIRDKISISVSKSLIGNKRSLGYKQSVEHRKKESESKKGEKAYQWKGEDVGYYALHTWITKQLGKPHYCEYCGRTDLPHRSYHWANKSDQYKRDIEDWIRLCVSCHKKYDKEKRKNGIIKKIKN